MTAAVLLHRMSMIYRTVTGALRTRRHVSLVCSLIVITFRLRFFSFFALNLDRRRSVLGINRKRWFAAIAEHNEHTGE